MLSKQIPCIHWNIHHTVFIQYCSDNWVRALTSLLMLNFDLFDVCVLIKDKPSVRVVHCHLQPPSDLRSGPWHTCSMHGAYWHLQSHVQSQPTSRQFSHYVCTGFEFSIFHKIFCDSIFSKDTQEKLDLMTIKVSLPLGA